MQTKKNDVKARTTLLLSLPDEHQLRFSKFKTAKELWATILKTFALMAIDGVGWDWSYMENEGEDHALVTDGEAPIEFALMANTESKEEHLALTVPAPALHSSISASEDSDQTEPFEEGKTTATPPPSAYH
nr:hypothetical protein [Tanacetum cinerariifolium]